MTKASAAIGAEQFFLIAKSYSPARCACAGRDDCALLVDTTLMNDESHMVQEIGLVHGRFQPLHVGHMEYILAAFRQCDRLIVGVSDPDPSQCKAEPSAPGRSAANANPFTFYERLLMIEGALKDAGMPRDAFNIVPFPISFPERLHYYSPSSTTHFITVYDSWGESKYERLSALGRTPKVLWRRNKKAITATKIRHMLVTDGPWQLWVPAATARVLEGVAIHNRLTAPAALPSKEEAARAA